MKVLLNLILFLISCWRPISKKSWHDLVKSHTEINMKRPKCLDIWMTNTAIEGAQHNSPCYIIAIKLLSQSRAQCRQIVCLQKDTESRFVVPRYIHCTVTLTHQFSTLAHHHQHCPTNTIQQPTKMLDWEIGKCHTEIWKTVASKQL